MSLDIALARVALLQSAFAQPASAQAPVARPAATDGSASTAAFAGMLGAAQSAPAARVLSPLGGTSAGQAMLAAAKAEVGVAEQPPGSNDSPRIAQYRQATAGSSVGPWCAYFASWAAREAGVPLGDSGQGFGRVDDVNAWAQRTGKAIPNGPGAAPQPGDLIVWDEHIGIVDSVDPDGTIHTVEGNSSNRVSERTYGPGGGGAIGYVRLG